MTVKLDNAPLREVLEEVGRQADFTVSVMGELDKTVSAEFTDVPLRDGLQRLLKGCGWMGFTQQDADHTLSRIFITRVLDHVPLVPHVMVTPSDTARAQLDPRVLRAAALAEKDEVKRVADAFFHDRSQLMDAVSGLIGAVSFADAALIADLVQDENVQESDWEAILEPTSDVLEDHEQRAVIRAVQTSWARERIGNAFAFAQDLPWR